MFYRVEIINGVVSVSQFTQSIIPLEMYNGIILSIIGGEIGFLGRFVDVRTALWSIDLNGNNDSIRFCWGGEQTRHKVTPDQFLDNIQRDYPDDLNLFLFHPEIFQGVFHADDL